MNYYAPSLLAECVHCGGRVRRHVGKMGHGSQCLTCGQTGWPQQGVILAPSGQRVPGGPCGHLVVPQGIFMFAVPPDVVAALPSRRMIVDEYGRHMTVARFRREILAGIVADVSGVGKEFS